MLTGDDYHSLSDDSQVRSFSYFITKIYQTSTRTNPTKISGNVKYFIYSGYKLTNYSMLWTYIPVNERYLYIRKDLKFLITIYRIKCKTDKLKKN